MPFSHPTKLSPFGHRIRLPHVNEQYKHRRQLGYYRLWMAIVGLVVIIWSIITIELTISWSNITNVNGVLSVGQLIPTVVGLFGLLRTIHSIIVKRADEVFMITT